MIDYVANLLRRWQAGEIEDEQVYHALDAAGATEDFRSLLKARIANRTERLELSEERLAELKDDE